MPAARFHLGFADGTSKTVTLGPLGLVAAERAGILTEDHKIEGSFYAAWYTLGRPGGDFEEWLSTVTEFEESQDPQPADQPSGLSPPSP